MDIRPIRTDQDHRAALAAIEACWGAPEGTEEGDKLDVLLALVEIYEAKRWPIKIDGTFDPVDVLRYAIDELGHTQAELAELLGSRSRASEVLSRQASAYGRNDSQDRRSMENSGRPSGSSLQDRTSRLTHTSSRHRRRALTDATGPSNERLGSLRLAGRLSRWYPSPETQSSVQRRTS